MRHWYRIVLLWLFLTKPVFGEEQNFLEPSTKNFVATIGALDKITARVTRLQLPSNVPIVFGTLTLVARACYVRPPIEPPETYVFLEIDDKKSNGEVARVFTGWMLASSPALNPLEHAVYDVWTISCSIR